MEFTSNDKEATSIARIIRHTPGVNPSVDVKIYPPLFPALDTKRPDHPTLPRHNQGKIVTGFGSSNVELYQSNRRLTISVNSITQIAFVFSYSEFASTELSWTEGIENVFFARFYEQLPNSNLRGDDFTLVRPFLDDIKLCFPNQQLPE